MTGRRGGLPLYPVGLTPLAHFSRAPVQLWHAAENPFGPGPTPCRAVVIAAGLLAVAACGGPAQPAEQTSAATAAEAVAAASAAAKSSTSAEVTATGTLAGPEATTESFTYNPAVAPAGAQLAVTAGAAADRTTVRLQATGLLPNRGYAAHVHQLPCGPTGAAAGPHHQHRARPGGLPGEAVVRPRVRQPAQRDLARPAHRCQRER